MAEAAEHSTEVLAAGSTETAEVARESRGEAQYEVVEEDSAEAGVDAGLHTHDMAAGGQEEDPQRQDSGCRTQPELEAHNVGALWVVGAEAQTETDP